MAARPRGVNVCSLRAYWWGAIVATILLIWDVIKWYRNTARVRVAVKVNAIYDDGEIIPLPGAIDGASGGLKEYIHVEIINVGTLPTTIMAIMAMKRFQSGEVGQSGKAFKEHFGKSLPCVLKPGEVWSCRADQARLFGLPGDAPLKVVIDVSHKAKPIVKKVVQLKTIRKN